MSDLSFATLHEFDDEPYTSGGITRYLCPFCHEDRPRDNVHRCVTVRDVDKVWHCMRCDERGVLREFRKHSRAEAMTHARRKRLGIFE
jgi:hypothetical protein